ncbi:MAG TPA: sugar-transfer associated ATP-grasp domain-containing protein [Gemmatimonadaceae bacterium]|nr:sugar-transfer associated ATP-grasp domain-containing protein [Gemmatimonadaceae bacterium]
MSSEVRPIGAAELTHAAATRRRAPRPFASSPGDRPGARRDGTAAAARILRLARRYHRAELMTRRGRPWAVRAALLAPARAAREALHAVRRYGSVTVEHDGISPLRQLAWTWWLNLRYEYDGRTVYRFRLFSRRRATPGPGFLQWEIASVLYRTVLARTAPTAAAILADKRRFAAWCADQRLPTAPMLMEFEGGRVSRRHVPDGERPASDLFAKWGAQYGGDDTQCWRHVDGRYLDDAGHAWTFDEIADALARRSTRGVVLLQPRLVNHPALRALSSRALSTLRIMTTQRPGEPPRFLAGVLRMGTGTSTADNFAQGGIASPVDADTGVIGEARRLDEEQRTYVYTTHPDTGATIPGFQVPCWREGVQLALDAHARLGPIACVGWDVAVLEDGPVLLEGNWNPCTKLLQVATQTPLLATEFADTFAAWLAEPACAVADRELPEYARWTPV